MAHYAPQMGFCLPKNTRNQLAWQICTTHTDEAGKLGFSTPIVFYDLFFEQVCRSFRAPIV